MFYAYDGRRVGTAAARSAPQKVAAGAPQPSHMTPCACHCAACRAAGHSNGACVILCAGLHDLFDGKADVVDLVLRHYYSNYGACGWGTAHLGAAILCVQYGPAGDVITAGDSEGRIHFICAQTGEKIVCPLEVGSAVLSVAYSPDGTKLTAGLGGPSNSVVVFDTQTNEQICSLNVGSWVLSVQFSPSGDTVAAGCDNGTVQIIDVATAQVKRPLKAHSKDNEECTCKHDAGFFGNEYEANPDCP